MQELLAIAIAGALGSVLRFLLSKNLQTYINSAFPIGILAVNVLGSFIMGMLTIILLERLNLSVILRAAILIGFLGGFTTFSSFSIDTINLIRNGANLQAGIYILTSVFLSLLACWFGIILGRII